MSLVSNQDLVQDVKVLCEAALAGERSLENAVGKMALNCQMKRQMGDDTETYLIQRLKEALVQTAQKSK